MGDRRGSWPSGAEHDGRIGKNVNGSPYNETSETIEGEKEGKRERKKVGQEKRKTNLTVGKKGLAARQGPKWGKKWLRCGFPWASPRL